MDDIFDTRFEGKKVELDDNKVRLGDNINLMQKDPALRKITIGAGWDLNAFDADVLDLDVSLFLLNKDDQTRKDEDFVFYNQPETEGVKHHGDSRTGAGDGDDELISLDLQAISYDILKIAIAVSVYKGYEKQQDFSMVRNAFLRIMNADTRMEICRFVLDDIFEDNQDTALIAGYLNREGPKWHFKPAAEFENGGLGALARKYGLIINQE